MQMRTGTMESGSGGIAPMLARVECERQSFLIGMRAVPGAVAIIATSNGDERLGLVATAWTSLSADPPTMLACINRSATAYNDIIYNRAFSINLLDVAQDENVAIFSAKRGLNRGERFLEGCWTTGPDGQPWLKDAAVSFECSLENFYEHGTHTVLIGRVGSVQVDLRREAMLYADGAIARAQIFKDSSNV